MSIVLYKGNSQNTHRGLPFSWSSDEPQRSVNLCRHMEGRPEEADTGCLPSYSTVLLRWRTGTPGPGSQLWILLLLLIICITWEANESQWTSSWLGWMPCRTVGSHNWEPLITAREALCTVHMTHTCYTAEDECQDVRLSPKTVGASFHALCSNHTIPQKTGIPASSVPGLCCVGAGVGDGGCHELL